MRCTGWLAPSSLATLPCLSANNQWQLQPIAWSPLIWEWGGRGRKRSGRCISKKLLYLQRNPWSEIISNSNSHSWTQALGCVPSSAYPVALAYWFTVCISPSWSRGCRDPFKNLVLQSDTEKITSWCLLTAISNILMINTIQYSAVCMNLNDAKILADEDGRVIERWKHAFG